MSTLWADVAVIWTWSVRVWRTRPGLLAWIVTGSLASSSLLVAFPWLWQYLIDALRDDAAPVQISELAAWMLGVGVAQVVVHFGVQAARAVGNAVVSRAARRTVVDSLVATSPDALRAWTAGELVSRLHDDAGDKVSWFLCSGVFRAWEALWVAGLCMAVMCVTEPGLAVWVVSPLPVLLVVQALSQSTLAARHRAVQRAIAATTEQVTSTFGAIRVVQACDLVETTRRRFRAATLRERDAEVRAAVVQQGIALLYQYGWQLAVGALLFFGGLKVMDGDLSLGRYVTFEALLATMVWPMFDLGTLMSRIPGVAVALRRLDAVCSLPRAAEGHAAWIEGELLVLQGMGVKADGVSVLDDIDLQVHPGERVAVVGPVGAGKTVLLEVVTGMRSPAAGRVEVGGRPLGPGGVAQPHLRVATVPQEASLLTLSVLDNILLGREVGAVALDRALRVSQLDRDLPQLPNGVHARVGERGVALSGGQRQRVALARALVGTPDLLVLDDATSALDAEVEHAFWSALAMDFTTTAALLVTHRVGTLATADRIVVLQAGRVAQRGRHANLLEMPGLYRRLYGEAVEM